MTDCVDIYQLQRYVRHGARALPAALVRSMWESFGWLDGAGELTERGEYLLHQWSRAGGDEIGPQEMTILRKVYQGEFLSIGDERKALALGLVAKEGGVSSKGARLLDIYMKSTRRRRDGEPPLQEQGID